MDWLRAHSTGDRFVNDPDGPFRLHNVGMVLYNGGTMYVNAGKPASPATRQSWL